MARRRCAFLSTDDLSDFVTYDHLAVPPLVARGWEVEAVPWRAELELIEPSLYFPYDEGSAERFAAAVDALQGRAAGR